MTPLFASRSPRYESAYNGSQLSHLKTGLADHAHLYIRNDYAGRIGRLPHKRWDDEVHLVHDKAGEQLLGVVVKIGGNLTNTVSPPEMWRGMRAVIVDTPDRKHHSKPIQRAQYGCQYAAFHADADGNMTWLGAHLTLTIAASAVTLNQPAEGPLYQAPEYEGCGHTFPDGTVCVTSHQAGRCPGTSLDASNGCGAQVPSGPCWPCRFRWCFSNTEGCWAGVRDGRCIVGHLLGKCPHRQIASQTPTGFRDQTG